ncbi:MAG TPA: hypothetical protein VJR02_10895 [Pyrinomonadaceae bacterium]|nr:hypothetical protein [Pyrinomonadaceae bacterium]
MDVNKLAGACLIVLGIINVLHELVVRSAGRGEPGIVYAFVTALFFTFGVALFLRKNVETDKHRQKVKVLSITRD